MAFRTRTVPDGPLVTKPTDDRYRLVDQQGKWRLLTVPPDRQRPEEGCPRPGRTRRPRRLGEEGPGQRKVEVIGKTVRPR